MGSNERILPNDWNWAKLGNLCNTTSGGTPSRRNPSYYNGVIPWVKSGELNYNIILDTEEKISEEALKNSSAKIFPQGTLLIALYGATIGKLAVLGINAATNQAVCGIFQSEKIETKFLYNYLLYKRPSLVKEGIGGAQPNISQSVIKNIDIPLPSTLVQRAIVSKIEELFSELDKGVEQLKTAQQQLKTYRQAVLKWAFEGKLTNENVKDGELPEGWRIQTFSDLATVNPKSYDKKPVDGNLEVQFLPMKLVEEEINKIHLTEVKLLKEVQKSSYTPFIDGDIIFAKVTPCMENGKIAVVEKLKNGIGYGSSEFHVVRCGENLLNKYAFYFLVQDRFRREAESVMTGAVGLRRVPRQFIENHFIPFPTIEEQKLIVQEIEARLSIVNKLEKTTQRSLEQAEFLRQSILKLAFEGRLLTTDTIETVKKTIQAIPPERKALAGNIIHLLHKDRHFGLTKFQKILYLAENFAQVSYETNFIQETAGPYDRMFTTEFRREMQEKYWIREEHKGNITKLIPGEKIDFLLNDYKTHFAEKNAQIEFVIQHLKEKSTHDAELIATLYAVWNNRILKKKAIKTESLVEGFFNWSAKKKEEFQQEEIIATYNWMKKIKLVPKGFGKVIGAE